MGLTEGPGQVNTPATLNPSPWHAGRVGLRVNFHRVIATDRP